jgi:hypothetical protein
VPSTCSWSQAMANGAVCLMVWWMPAMRLTLCADRAQQLVFLP